MLFLGGELFCSSTKALISEGTCITDRNGEQCSSWVGNCFTPPPKPWSQRGPASKTGMGNNALPGWGLFYFYPNRGRELQHTEGVWCIMHSADFRWETFLPFLDVDTSLKTTNTTLHQMHTQTQTHAQSLLGPPKRHTNTTSLFFDALGPHILYSTMF